MCHDKNIRDVVGPKKSLKAILDILPNVKGIYAPFLLVL